MSIRDRTLLFVALALAVVVCDWGAKLLAEQILGPGLVVYNPKPPAYWAIPISAAATVVMVLTGRDRLLVAGLAILTGGWVANFTDRWLFGPVADFIPLPEFGESKYIANLADLSIAIGSLLLVIYVARLYLQHRAESSIEKPEPVVEEPEA